MYSMKQLQIDVPQDILISLNETEHELKQDMKLYTAIWYYLKGKLTIGKAALFAGMKRTEFEQLLSENQLPVSLLTYDDVIADYNKLQDI